MANKTTNKIDASVLSFTRQIQGVDVPFFGTKWNERDTFKRVPVTVKTKTIRGVMDCRKRNNKAITPDANAHKVDYAVLPQSCDTLCCDFTLEFLPCHEPWNCNGPETAKGIAKILDEFKGADGYRYLAERYAVNIVNARGLFRNRFGCDDIEVRIYLDKNSDKFLTFNAFDYSLKNFKVPEKDQEKIQFLAEKIREGFMAEEYGFSKCRIVYFAHKDKGSEVFPSEEWTDEKGKGEGSHNKILFSLEDNITGFHSQKITNAINTIDDWYEDAAFPIPVNSHGIVTGVSINRSTKENFFKYFDRAILNGGFEYGEKPTDDALFVFAKLVVGGVMGESSKEK